MDNDEQAEEDSTPTGKSAVVGLLFEHDENRRQLTKWFRELSEFTPCGVSPSGGSSQADILLVDEPALARHRDWLQSRKGREEPPFHPIVLVHSTDDSSFEGGVWEIIDETVSVPIDPSPLKHRLKNLLERRRLSKNLSSELERTEKQYRAVFESVNDAMLVIDAEQDQVLDCNPRAREVLGYSESELRALSASTDLHPTNGDAYEQFIERVLTEGRGRTEDIVCTTKDGSKIEAEISASMLDVEDSSRVVFCIRDITERREQSRQLESQRDQLAQLNRINRTLHETTRAVVQASSRDELETAVCQNLSASDAYQFAWIGESAEEHARVEPRATGEKAAEYLNHVSVTTDGTETSQGPTGQALETLSVCTVQDVSTASDMEPWRDSLAEFGVRATAAVPIHYDDEIYGILNLYTERENAFVGEERDILSHLGNTIGRAIADIRAREEAQIFQQAVEHAGHAIYITEPDGTIEFVNSAFTEMTGYNREEVIGKNPRILKSGAHDKEFYRDLWQTVLSGETWENELINRRKDGRRQYIDQTIAPITMGSDDIDYFVAVNTDITQQRRRRQQLQVLYRVLRHNLRNELNVIEGYADLLAESGTSQQESALTEISQAVDDLLQISQQARRIESTFTEESADQEVHSLDEVVQEALADAAVPEDKLTTSIPETSFTANMELKTAIQELVVNAFKHNDAEEPSVSVTMETEGNRNAPYGKVVVRDNGPGIPSNEREVLREGEESPLLHGNGLGLWLVNWVVSELGGSIDIQDANPHGSLVTVTVPLRD
ncbi:PAS domain S-box protein [Haloplanus litoreus]|uniref:PAS domain S-box protein n=1 Tax=Haloplanus litoreus TaxID=767515 RepID=A0ABD6A407_9EURY